MSVKIRIIVIPNGEAPEHIRQAWVGTEFKAKRKKNVITVGVLSAPRSFVAHILFLFQRKYTRTSGYTVKAREAMNALAEHNPQAAEWWQQNCPALKKYGTFMFSLNECQEI